MTDLISVDLVDLDADLGAAAPDVIDRLTQRVAAAGRSANPAGLRADAMAREGQSATGLPGGIAIPHCRSEHVRSADPGLRPAAAARRLRRPGRPGRPRLPHRRARRRGSGAPQAPLRAGPRAGEAGVQGGAAVGLDARRGRHARRRRRPAQGRPGRARCRRRRVVRPGRCGVVGEGRCCPRCGDGHRRRRAGRAPPHRRRHRLPDRHRPHLHGRRLARRRRQAGRGRGRHRDAGLVRLHPARPVGDLRGRRRHLRHRRGRQGARALRRPAGHRLRREARHQRARRHGLGGPARCGRPQGRPGRGHRLRGHRRDQGHQRAVVGRAPAPDPAHRRQLHDPVHGGRRSAHRARLPASAATT